MDDRSAHLGSHANDVRSGIGVLGGGVELAVAPIGEGAGHGGDDHGGERDPAYGREGARAGANLGRSVLIHVFYLGCGGGMNWPSASLQARNQSRRAGIMMAEA